ncbi:hypothetical protein EG328_009515 [Venturia inaequalis]|uniref:Zn(2)-C6 fungal-type domain-containing protein n=1 Tax=Venturia inaequalis TaxID=5025 RepID=A0A8H3YPK5_VENIN|nr:hypothetical protein EG328_009515 [Venturia inaequalis]
MAGPYPNFPNYGMYTSYYNAGQNGRPLIQPNSYYGRNLHFQQPLLDPLSTHFPEFDDQNHAILSAQGSTRTRKRLGPGGDHVKFRRTRSGCFTCRNRRVKCDEAHPVCERCRKGGRECVYPEPASSTKRRGSTKSKSPHEGEDFSHDEDDFDDNFLDDEGSPTTSLREPAGVDSPQSSTKNIRASSDPPALTHGASPTPSTDGSGRGSGRAQSTTPARQLAPTARLQTLGAQKRPDLPADVKFYLEYARTKLTNHHWEMKLDGKGFLNKTLIEVALRFEPLLYAVVGFAAYHFTLSKPDGKLEDFLGYYQKSVSLLRETIKQKPNLATIMTILQLATIEEFLGDWVNLMRHQRAALALITKLYTPASINANESLRKIFQWYIRFDTFVGLLSGSGVQMGLEWIEAQHDFYVKKCSQEPDELYWKYEERWAFIRLTGQHIGDLGKRRAQNAISEQEFKESFASCAKDVWALTDNLHPALTDRSKLVRDFPSRPDDFDSIVDPYEPDLLYGGDIYDTNMLIHDLIAYQTYFKQHIGNLQGIHDDVGMRRMAFRMCQIYEALKIYPASPAGIELGMQAGQAYSVLYLRQNEKEILWGRRTMAEIEARGYTYPITLRNKLEDLWNVDLSDWWLPNGEGCPPVIRQIRNFIVSTPNDTTGEDLRSFKGIFASLSLSETSSPAGSSHTSPETQDSSPPLQRQTTGQALYTATGNSDDDRCDWKSPDADDRAVAFGESPEYGWS